jgi:hypothetical protein
MLLATTYRHAGARADKDGRAQVRLCRRSRWQDDGDRLRFCISICDSMASVTGPALLQLRRLGCAKCERRRPRNALTTSPASAAHHFVCDTSVVISRQCTNGTLQLRPNPARLTIVLGFVGLLKRACRVRALPPVQKSPRCQGFGAGEGNRTLVCSLGSCRSAIELRPRRAHGPDLAETAPSAKPLCEPDGSAFRAGLIWLVNMELKALALLRISAA